MHLGRDCKRTMVVHLNEQGLLYDDLKRIFDRSTDETLFHSHLVEAGVAWKP